MSHMLARETSFKSIPLAVLISVLFTARADATPLDPLAFSSIGTLNVTSGTLFINTDSLQITGAANFTGEYYQQGGADFVSVFAFDNINIGPAVTVVNSGTFPLVLLSHGSVTLGAAFNANGGTGSFEFPGAGILDGDRGGFGGYVSVGENGQGPGGGPRGFSRDFPWAGGGGHGGQGGSGVLGAGATHGDILTLLHGGSGGGGGGGNTDQANAGAGGGAGGGAIEIGAVGSIQITGTLAANGGSGATFYEGGGGGSGGALLIHGSSLSVTGAAQANGGAGSIDQGSGAPGGGGGGGRIAVLGLTSTTFTVGGALTGLPAGVTANASGGGQAGVITVGVENALIPSGFSVVLDGAPVLATTGQTGNSDPRIEAIIRRNVTIDAGGAATLGANEPLSSSSLLTVNGTFNLAGFNQTIATLDGSGVVSLGGGSLTVGTNNATSTFSGSITGGGSLTKIGAGTLSVTGTNNYSNGTNVLAGTLRGNSNSLQGSINNQATLEFNQTSAGHFLGSIAGPGAVIKSGPGTLTLPGSHSMGSLAVDAGSLVLANGTLSTGSTVVASSAELQLGGLVTIGSGVNNLGLVTGTGRIEGHLANQAAAEVSVNAGEQITVVGAGNSNNGLISLSGGTLRFQQDLTNQASGIVVGQGTLRSGGLINHGTMAFTGSANIQGDVQNTATGEIIASGGGPTSFFDDVVNDGQIRTSAGSFSVFFGSLSGAGTFTGTGTVNIEGDLLPGSSPAIVNFGGNVNWGPVASLEIEIGGLTPGNNLNNHDQVNVAGTAGLDGTLQMVLFNGFLPVPGDQIVAMTYGTRNGTFPNVTGSNPQPGLTLTPVYQPNRMLIVASATGDKVWGVDANGNSSLGANWLGGVAPGGVGDRAAFTTLITNNRTVTVDSSFTVGTLTFDDNNNYLVQGPGTINLQVASGDALIDVKNLHGNGTHTISASISLASNMAIAQGSSAPFALSGALNNSAGRTIAKNGSGALNLSGQATHGSGALLDINAGVVNVNASVNNPLGANLAVQIDTGATLALTAGSSTIKSIRGSGGTIDVADGSTLTLAANATVNHIVGALDMNVTGTLDLTNGSLIVDYTGASPYDQLRTLLLSGQNLSGGFWDGTGIVSSTSLADGGLTAIGIIEASDLALLGVTTYVDPQSGSDPLDADAIVLKYTYWGDADLDGDNDVDDFIFWSSGFPSSSGATWFTGDFDYDGDNDVDDFVFWSSTFPTPAPLLGDFEGTAAVPEPGGLSLALIAVVLFAVAAAREAR